MVTLLRSGRIGRSVPRRPGVAPWIVRPSGGSGRDDSGRPAEAGHPAAAGGHPDREPVGGRHRPRLAPPVGAVAVGVRAVLEDVGQPAPLAEEGEVAAGSPAASSRSSPRPTRRRPPRPAAMTTKSPTAPSRTRVSSQSVGMDARNGGEVGLAPVVRDVAAHLGPRALVDQVHRGLVDAGALAHRLRADRTRKASFCAFRMWPGS